MLGRDAGWIVLLLLAFSGRKGKASSTRSTPRRAPGGDTPDRNMTPEEQAERLPISTGEWVTLDRGRAYRITGDLESSSPIDVERMRQMMQFAGGRDVTIGERPPHRAAWSMTAPLNMRWQLGKPLPFQLGGVKLRLRSVRAVAGSSVVVGSN